MRKQLRFLLLLWIFGCTWFFSCGALAAAKPYTNYPSDDLGSTNVITDSSENLRERTGYGPIPPSHSLVADFGAMGALWRYDVGSHWRQLTSVSSNLMLASLGGLVANFPGHGLYHYDGLTWTQLTPNDTVQALFGYDVLFADYGTLGLWKFDGSWGSWAQITSADANLLGSYGGNLVANFAGLGLYKYDGETWTQLTPNDTVQALIETGGILYADYGTLGLWKYDGEWNILSYDNPNKMLAWGNNLVANFPGCGIYRYDGTTWTQLTPNDTVQALIEVSGILYADHGKLGLWQYTCITGSWAWAQIASGDANLLGEYWIYGGPWFHYFEYGLVANFPMNGGLKRYSYNGVAGSWELLTSNSGVTNMVDLIFY
jgi:hypothetical protein